MRKFLVFIFIISLSSCATNHMKPGATKTVNPDDGILVASVTWKIKGEYGASGSFWFENSNKDKIYNIKADSDNPFDSSSDSKLAVPKGLLNVISLPPGEYYLAGWELSKSDPYTTITFKSKKFIKKKFTIEKGKVTYLGRYHLESIYGKNVFGIEVLGGAESSCTNHIKQDLTVFKTNFPTFSNLPVMNQFQKC